MNFKEHVVRTLINFAVIVLWILSMPLYIAIYKEIPILSTLGFAFVSMMVIVYLRERYRAFVDRVLPKPEPVVNNVIPIDEYRELFPAPKIRNRSTKNGEHMTPDEETWIRMRSSKHLPECPDCGIGTFLEGPSGGMSVNFKCSNANCETKVNFSGPFGFDRISDASPSKRLGVVTTQLAPPYR